MAEINLNADYIPELVEFWAAKYKAIKEELESHKASSGVEIEKERRALAEERKKLQEILSSFHGERLEWRASEKGLRDTTSRVREEASASQKNLAASEKEISQLSVRLANLETEKLGLSHTVQTMLSQATALSAEIDLQRRLKIATMFPPGSFVEESFVHLTLAW